MQLGSKGKEFVFNFGSELQVNRTFEKPERMAVR
jgi:hypothetical protein